MGITVNKKERRNGAPVLSWVRHLRFLFASKRTFPLAIGEEIVYNIIK